LGVLEIVDVTGIPHTCPKIDHIKRDLKDAVGDIRQAVKGMDCEDDINLYCRWIEDAMEELEDVRDANLALRNFGIRHYKEA
jgi:metal-sulfur cluster biosynthetic enzyme